jgi:hypothetical protein
MCALVVGIAQANIITVNPTATTAQGDTKWQDIKGVSYSWDDVDGNGQITVGETVTFSVTMEKTYWGTHDYDALKFWIDGKNTSGSTTNLYTSTLDQGKWDFDPTNTNMKGKSDTTWKYVKKRDGSVKKVVDNIVSKTAEELYSYKQWTGGDTTFTFTYTFSDTGTYNITQSVMCSRDLSNLTTYGTSSDWAAWTEDIHTLCSTTQGETEKYSITVVSKSVPEPGTFSLLACGLMSLAGAAFFRRKKK